ncbi:hypothetical protein Taro_031661 [Colocasia esculenta]|uniref:CCHC-type domain-containing protein n=1 Tax=Colocasia esculenta TaxID=4460 RepID=A0A843VSL4_COLES|nr:hypothetical protein [Colocasia esculenta]
MPFTGDIRLCCERDRHPCDYLVGFSPSNQAMWGSGDYFCNLEDLSTASYTSSVAAMSLVSRPLLLVHRLERGREGVKGGRERGGTTQLRRYFKKGKDFKKLEVKDTKKVEPICYECKKPGHIKAECPKLKKTEFRKKDNSKKFRKYKKKAMAAAWDNHSDSDSESSSSEEEEEKANLAFMANTEDKNFPSFNPMAVSGVSGTVGGYNAAFLTAEQ